MIILFFNLIIYISTAFFSYQETDFEGYILYEKKSNNKPNKPYLIVYYKNGFVRTKILHIVSSEHYKIIKFDSTYLIDNNQKVIRARASENINYSSNLVVVKSDSVRNLLGISCKNITYNYDFSDKFDIMGFSSYYYSEKLPDTGSVWEEFSPMKGTPLYVYTKNKNTKKDTETTTEFIATEIVHQSLPDSLFELPKDYKIIYPK